MNNEQVQQIFVEDIIPNRFQPRLTFDEKALKELSDSIKVHGVIQPLVLRKVGNKYEIIAGERRYKASCMAGLTKVPAIVRELTDNESAEIALIENVQRKNLSSIEEAKSYKNLLDRGYLTQDELAKKIGVTQSTIANKMRLLNLCDEVQDALLNEKISERHARSLLQIDSPDEQKRLLDRIIKERLTVKQLDSIIKREKEGVNMNQEGVPTPPGGDLETVAPNMQTDKQTTEPLFNPFSEQDVSSNTGGTSKFFTDLPPIEETEQTVDNNLNDQVSVPSDMNTNVVQDVPPAPVQPPVAEQPQETPNIFDAPATEVPPVVPQTPEAAPQAPTAPQEPVAEAAPPVENKPDDIETFDMFGDVIDVNAVRVKEQEELNSKPSVGDQINVIRDAIKHVESSGFPVECEEYDLEDIYQINIKIKKEE